MKKVSIICALVLGTTSVQAVDMLCLTTGPEQVSKLKFVNIQDAAKMQVFNPDVTERSSVTTGNIEINGGDIRLTNECDNDFTFSFDVTRLADFQRGLIQRITGDMRYAFFNSKGIGVSGRATMSCYRF